MNKFLNILSKYWLIILIIIFAFVLRFWHLSSYPALNADEAAIGYNAYSLIKTGFDEHGNSWPIHFQSFNDYKPGLYFYIVLPFVKLLGLTELAVRIPGALLGVATVFLSYLFVNELFTGKNLRYKRFSVNVGEIVAFLVAISPWHIHYSRGGWEVNVATFFILLGVLSFVKFTKKEKPKFLFLSLVSFVLSLYCYHAARVISPLLGVGLLVIYRKEIFQKKYIKLYILSLVVSVVVLLPLVKDLLGPAGISRATGVGLFADTGPLSRINEQRGEHQNITSFASRVFHNKAVNYGLAFMSNWAAHYHGEFLFLSGDVIQRNRVPETGQLYFFEVITILLGIIVAVKNLNKSWCLVLFWLIIAPVAAALTFQSPHALRAENMVLPLEIISGYGLFVLIEYISVLHVKRVYKYAFFVITFGLVFVSFARYLHMYYVHMSKEYPYSSQYGVKELVSYISENSDRYNKVLVTNRYDQPYILFLFYMKYDPLVFQGQHTLTARDSYGFSTVNHFGKYYFSEIIFDKAKPENPNSMIVGTKEDVPVEANIVKKIYGSNGYQYFSVVAN